jgi:hypothetical protein
MNLVAWRRASGSLVASLVILASVLLVAPGDLAIADDSAGDVTWSVRPANASGPDGRAWVELTLDPGEHVTEHLVIVNHSRQRVEFALSAADGYFTDTGRFNMLPSDRESEDAGRWVDIPASIKLEAGESAVVPFTVTVPENATPGDHPAGVAASILSTDGALGVESRVGFRVMTRVTGALTPSLAVHAEGTFLASVNPFEPGRATVQYRVENTGNVRLATSPTVRASGPFGMLPAQREAEPIVEFAPSEHRDGSLVLQPLWPVFVYTIEVTATGSSVSDEMPSVTAPPAVATVTVVAIPWSQLVVLVIAVLLGVFWWRGRRRRRTELARAVDRAREEGRGLAAREHSALAVVIAVILGGVAALSASPPARAHDEDPAGISIFVEIPPTPWAPGSPAAPDPLTLGETGGHDATLVLVIGGLLTGSGLVMLGMATVRPRRRE